jgi:predicted PurR-regulated permease PerM
LGGVLAFILNVPMRAFEKWLSFVKAERPRRLLAILATVLAICIVLAGVVMLIIPQIEETIDLLMMQLPSFFDKLYLVVMDFLEERPELMEWVSNNIGLEKLNWSGIIEKIASLVGESFTKIFNRAVSAVTGVFGVAFNGILGTVFAFYCMAQKETLARQGRKIAYAVFKEHIADEMIRILRMTNSAFSNFLTGQSLEALILGLLFVPAMAIAKMPYIPLICVLIAVTAMVPLVGAFIGCILGAFFILVSNPMQAVVFVIMFLAIQQFEGNVIYPRVVGESIGLPGMWVLLAVTVGGEIMGVGGMLLMIPLASVVYSLLREITNKRLAQRNIDPEKLKDHPPELKSKFKENRERKQQEKLMKQMKELAERAEKAASSRLHKKDE